MPTTPAELFGAASTLALLGWAALALGIAVRAPILRDRVAGLAVPLAFSVLYAGVVAANWSAAEGGFESLAAVATLFGSDWMLLAGWVHFLAYDLFVGAWIARDADARGAPRWLLIPVLPLAFLFGPAGFLLWAMIRAAVPARAEGAFA